jgi:flavorubredoxin
MVNEYSDFLPHLNPRILFDILLSRKPRIMPVVDISPYDVVCVGTPNWYGRIAPPINTFIHDVTIVDGKRAMAFVSSGWGKENYADDLKNKLEEKGFKVLKKLSIILADISESQLKEIKEILTG